MDENRKRPGAEEEITIDLAELFFLFRKKLSHIILFALIGAILAGAVTYFGITPKYTSTAKIYIVSASSDSVINLSDLQLGTNLTTDYKELMLVRPMLESVIRNLNLQGMTTNALKKMISINNTSGSRVLNITVTSTDPQMSADIANELARLSTEWLPSVMAIREPNIAENAIAPTARSSPSYSRNVVIGALAVAALYMALCVIRYLYNDTITSSEQMEKYFGIVPLTAIPEEREANDGIGKAEEKGLVAQVKKLVKKWWARR